MVWVVTRARSVERVALDPGERGDAQGVDVVESRRVWGCACATVEVASHPILGSEYSLAWAGSHTYCSLTGPGPKLPPRKIDVSFPEWPLRSVGYTTWHLRGRI